MAAEPSEVAVVVGGLLWRMRWRCRAGLFGVWRGAGFEPFPSAFTQLLSYRSSHNPPFVQVTVEDPEAAFKRADSDGAGQLLFDEFSG